MTKLTIIQEHFLIGENVRFNAKYLFFDNNTFYSKTDFGAPIWCPFFHLSFQSKNDANPFILLKINYFFLGSRELDAVLLMSKRQNPLKVLWKTNDLNTAFLQK